MSDGFLLNFVQHWQSTFTTRLREVEQSGIFERRSEKMKISEKSRGIISE